MSDSIEHIFEEMGGNFVLSPFLFKQGLANIKALVFDWDGVFHGGEKNEHASSSFNESDSMGINMLRFGFYLQNGSIPLSVIVTGERNQTAFHWAEREHMHAVLYRIKNKVEALHFLERQYNIKADEILFVFDDILDLSLAKEVKLRLMVRNTSSPLLAHYCTSNKLCDYLTAHSGGERALREISEMCLGLMGRFNETVEKRIHYTGDYETYIEKRNDIETSVITLRNGLPVVE